MGLQVLAYGGGRPAPFHRVICQSQALEPGMLLAANAEVDLTLTS